MSARATDAPPLRAVLLDVDGTLVDSNDAHARSWVDALAQQGIVRRFDQIRPLMGMGGDKVMPEIAAIDAESARGKALGARRWEIFARDYLPSLHAFSGVATLLDRLRRDGYTIVVASSAKESELRPLLRVANAEWLLGDATSSSDAESSKPDPDIMHAALARAGVGPEEAVMIGDTPYDIEAAARAGVPTIALRSGGWWSDEDLAAAAERWPSVSELVREYETSMLCRRAPRK